MTNTIKTAISIQKTLFNKAEILARQLNISRSQLYGLAIENYLKKHQNQALLDDINSAYTDESDVFEVDRLSKMKKSHRKIVESKW
jgi:metal-responsive CopG/Arc/MetJ family transcriptional regulator